MIKLEEILLNTNVSITFLKNLLDGVDILELKDIFELHGIIDENPVFNTIYGNENLTKMPSNKKVLIETIPTVLIKLNDEVNAINKYYKDTNFTNVTTLGLRVSEYKKLDLLDGLVKSVLDKKDMISDGKLLLVPKVNIALGKFHTLRKILHLINNTPKLIEHINSLDKNIEDIDNISVLATSSINTMLNKKFSKLYFTIPEETLEMQFRHSVNYLENNCVMFNKILPDYETVSLEVLTEEYNTVYNKVISYIGDLVNDRVATNEPNTTKVTFYELTDDEQSYILNNLSYLDLYYKLFQVVQMGLDIIRELSVDNVYEDIRKDILELGKVMNIEVHSTNVEDTGPEDSNSKTHI